MGTRAPIWDETIAQGAERRCVAVLLPASVPHGSFVAAAIHATTDLTADAGVHLDVRHGHEGPPAPWWTAVLCHGGQWASWIREFDVAATRRVVMTDRVDLHGADDRLGAVVMVDWQWSQAAYLAGALAAHLTSVAGTEAEQRSARLGLLAGPPVPTQRRVASAFAAGAHDGGHTGEISIAYATGFDDAASSARLARTLITTLGCAVVGHAADSAGEEGCRLAREGTVATIGFLEPMGSHVAVVDSDVRGVVAHLLDALIHDLELPDVFPAGLASGYLDLAVRDPAFDSVLAPHRASAVLM